MKNRERGAAGFSRYYETLFARRWADLRVHLEQESPALAWSWSDETDTPAYYLDPASVAVAYLLPLGEQNLDMCAAPGGKTLVLARRLAAQPATDRDSTLIANERSRERRARLHRVLEEHLPPEIRARVQVTGHDATRWGLHQPDRYDAILADVPCSSERHVLADSRALAQWGRSRITRLAAQQFAILAAAIDSLRPGGHLLYATCALTPLENDEVIHRALHRRREKVELVPLTPHDVRTSLPRGIAATHPALLEGVEQTQAGLRILPDRCGGAGPMYCALLRRTPGGDGTF